MGTITVQETKAPAGYKLDPQTYTVHFTVNDKGEVRSDLAGGTVISLDQPEDLALQAGESPIRGGVSFEKYDAESRSKQPTGEASLEGAEITVYNASDKDVYAENADGKLTAAGKGQAVLTLTTDADGHAESAARALPYGSYTAKETKPSIGYVLNQDWSVSFDITKDGQMVRIGGADDMDRGLMEEVVRTDLVFDKQSSDGSGKALIPFAIDRMQKVDGQWTVVESHVIVSDAQGHVSTKGSDRSRGKANSLDLYVNRGVFMPSDKLDPSVGVWFGSDYGARDDQRGAVLCGTYRIRELQCDDNRSCHEDLLVSDLFTVQDTSIIEHQPLVDLSVDLRSELVDSNSASHALTPNSQVDLTETLQYANLKPSSRYRMEAVLMDAAHKTQVGQAQSQDFTPEEAGQGSLTFAFSVDTTSYQGRKLAATTRLFEYLDDQEGEYQILIHSHNVDLDDAMEEVVVPTMSTRAMDISTQDNVGSAVQKTAVRDTVELFSLVPGQEYLLKERLVDRQSGQEVGTAQIVFKAPLSQDKDKPLVNMEGDQKVALPDIPLDASGLAGKTLTAFETLYKADKGQASGEPLAVHESKIGSYDYDTEADEDQSVHYPAVHTSACDRDSKGHEGQARKDAVIVDKVVLDNLIPGAQYTISGTLVYQSDGNGHKAKDHVLLKEGSVSRLTFTAQKPHEEYELTYKIDASGLEGQTVVVFEDLLHNDQKVASHADLSDQGQSVKLTGKPPVPKTGDRMHPVLYGCLFTGALAALAACLAMSAIRKRSLK